MTPEEDPQDENSSIHEEPKTVPNSASNGEDELRTVTWDARLPAGSTESNTPLPVAFGDYLLIQRIAGGGMGVVYKAVHQKLHRTVALKLILAGQLASDEEISRFHLEAEAAAQLDHPGIVPLYEVGEHQGQHFLAMSFVEGGSLATRLKEGPLPGREAARLMQRLAEAVAYAHAHGIIHRDLKPGNILIDGDGQPRITDFGLAKNVHGDSHLTVAGQIVGTPSYMPPEQASGDLDRIGPASDIYSLGAVLYCLLTGRPPFQAATVMETLRQVMEQDPAPPRRLNASIDRDLETICLKCLRKDPKNRYADATALAEDLRRFQNGEPILARPVGRLERVRRWCRRNPLSATLAAGVVLSLLFGMGFVLYFAEQARTEAALAKANEEKATENEHKALAEKALSDRRLYDVEINLAFQAWKDSRLAVAQELLDHHKPRGTEGADYRDFEWHYLQRLCQLAHLHELKGHSLTVWKVAYSPDGRRLASCSWDGTVIIWDAVTWERLFTLREHSGPVTAVSFSPTGARLATGDEYGVLKVWDAASGKQISSWKAHEGRIQDLAFRPDGQQIASASFDKNVKLWDASTGQEVRTLSHTEGVWCVAYSPDGRSLASGGFDGCDVHLWDADTGKQRRTLRHTGTVRCLAYSADGRQLACGDNQTLRVWNLLSGEPIRSFRGHSGVIYGVAFSPDGRRIASCSSDQTLRVWDLGADLDTLTLRHSHTVFGLAFRPDGRFLASAGGDGTVRIWDATDPELERLVLPGHQGLIMKLAYRPDGQRFASSTQIRTGPRRMCCEMRVWDAEKMHVLHTFRLTDRIITSLAYSADSRWLAASLYPGSGQPQAAPAQIKIWDAATGEERGLLSGHSDLICSLAFGPDGRLASGSRDHTIRIWDVDTMRPLRTLLGHSSQVTALAFSRDGRLASGSHDRTVRIWDLTAGEEPVALMRQPGAVNSLVFSPSGDELACACKNSVSVWDTRSKEKKLELKGNNETLALAYSPRGERIVTSEEAGIKIWDAKTGIEQLTLPTREGRRDRGGDQISAYVRPRFRPDGTQLIAGLDSSLHVWDSRKLTDELREEYEARAVVRLHSAGSKTPAEVLRSISKDPLLRESVRARALALAKDQAGTPLAH